MQFRLPLILVILGLLLSTLGCTLQKSQSSDVVEPTINAIRERGTLLVGTTGDYRPLTYREPDTNAYWGCTAKICANIVAIFER